MKSKDQPTGARMGITVKSGWAAVVLLSGPATSPRVVESCTVNLSDPADPEAKQPYHDGYGTARAEGAELSRLVASVKRYGTRSVDRLVRRFEAAGHSLKGAALVVGSLIDPETVGNSHVRVHALEGRLFRGVVLEAAENHGLKCTIVRERDLYERASLALNRSEKDLKRALSSMERPSGGPWRAEQKSAALAAWVELARSPRRLGNTVRARSSRGQRRAS